MIRLQSTRLIHRTITSEDIPQLLKFYQTPINMKYILSGRYDWTEDEFIKHHEPLTATYQYGYGFLCTVLAQTNQIIGKCGLLKATKDPDDHSVLELAYLVDHKFWRKGYATEAVDTLMKYAFEDLKIDKLVANTYKANLNSNKILVRSGFILNREFRNAKGSELQEYSINSEAYFT